MKRTNKIVTPPVNTPVTLTEAKAQLIVTHSGDDELIARLINVATANVEQVLQRKLITQTWKMYLEHFPAGNDFAVSFGDLQSVTHVKYTDEDDTESTFSSGSYYVNTDKVPGEIVLKADETWPTDTLRAYNGVEVQFVTGYGDDSTDVPEDIRHAILYLISHYYDNREEVLVGTIFSKLPMTSQALLGNHRIWEWIL